MIAKEWEEIGFSCTHLDRVDDIIICHKGNRMFSFIDGELYHSKEVKRITKMEEKAIKAQVNKLGWVKGE